MPGELKGTYLRPGTVEPAAGGFLCEHLWSDSSRASVLHADVTGTWSGPMSMTRDGESKLVLPPQAGGRKAYRRLEGKRAERAADQRQDDTLEREVRPTTALEEPAVLTYQEA